MSAIVIDLAVVRTERDTIVSHARAFMADLARFVVQGSIAAADRAFAVADPAHDTDPDLARDVYRAAHRRLRANLRRRLGREAHPDMERQVLEQGERVFKGLILQLEDERDAKLGGAA